MKFVFGIGNPGRSYAKTRHNIGFRALEALAGTFDSKAAFKRSKDCSARICETPEAFFILPETFVNLTGESVRAVQKKFSADPKDMLVLCDDVNLVFGKLRLRAGGSAGGHHGLESMIEALGLDAFARLRIGIGSDAMPKENLAPYVLSKFDAREEEELPIVLEKVSRVCECWIREGFDAALRCLSREQSKQEE